MTNTMMLKQSIKYAAAAAATAAATTPTELWRAHAQQHAVQRVER